MKAGCVGLGCALWLSAQPCLAQSDPAAEGTNSPPKHDSRYPVTFELAALTTLQPKLFELPLVVHGGRATLGARVHTSQYFSYAPQLLVEVYRGATPHGLTFSSSNIALLMDVTIGVPWLHWEAFVGPGMNTMERLTEPQGMSNGGTATGISVSAEYTFSERAHVFALLGQRWSGDFEATTLGLGFRM